MATSTTIDLPADLSASARVGRLRRVFGFPVLLVVLLAGFAFLLMQKTNADPDIGWHLRNAQHQIDHHAFLRQDIYSFTTRGKPWMDDEWLAEIPYYLAWKALGPRGIFLLSYLLITGILLGIFALAAMRSRNVKSAFLVSLAAAVLATVSYGPRTLLFGWLFLVVELAILYSFERGRNALWALPPLFLFWINAHGSWMIGFVLLVVFATSGLVEGEWGLIEARRWNSRQLRSLALVIGLTAAVLFINPYGWRLVEYPFDMAFHQKLNIANVMEWRSVDFHSLRGKFALFVLLAGLLVQLVRRRRWRLYDVGLLLLGIYSGFTYSRFLFLAAILVIPLLAPDLDGWLLPYAAVRDKPWLNASIMLLCLAAIEIKFPTSQRLAHAWSARYPSQARTYLQQFHPEGNVLNDYLWGGYLIWNVRQIPVFVDSRVDVFERNGVFKDSLDVANLDGSLAILDKYCIRYVLYAKDAPLSYLLSHTPGWRIKYEDPATVLFEREGNWLPSASCRIAP